MSSQILLKTVKPISTTHSGCVIFFHGSGGTGPEILEWLKILVQDFSLPHIKFVFPTAPLMPYTPLDGERSHVWFDRFDVSPHVPEHRETIDSMAEKIVSIIKSEVANGVPLNRIIIGGFSMGGCLALHIAYRFLPGLGGVFALSSFLNDDSDVYGKLHETTATKLPPLFMCHGERDTLVPIQWGRETFNKITALKVKGEFMPLRNTLHELRKEEIHKLLDWINTTIPR